jgi:2,3-dihydroxybiphenyl 1,2-dioxygenase
MTQVHALGYIVVRGPVAEWREFATTVLGAQVVPESDDGELRLRTDERAYRIIVQDGPPAGPASLVALGLETLTAQALEDLATSLAVNGVEFVDDKELAERRQVRRLLSFTDPDGTTCEAYYGQASDHRAFVSPTGATFVAGALGVGHTFLLSRDTEQAVAFYTGVLGFRTSDTIAFGPALGTFLHCNPRHHSVAFAAFPGAPAGIGHLMLEVESLSTVGRALDLVLAGPQPPVMAIGEHTNDLMTSFYVRTPSGFDIEYGWNGLLIDDAEWAVGHHSSASNWGHQPPVSREGAPS